MKQPLEEGLARLELSLAPSQIDQILRYHELLSTRGLEIGAIARSDRDRILERHVLDSLRAARHVGDSDRIAYDLGSGAGLPGIPLAIARPECGFLLVESRHWRAAFLEMVVAELGLNARVERARVETMGVQANLAFARAFAPLGKTWAMIFKLLKPDGRLVFFAGGGMADPVGEARTVAGDDAEIEVEPALLDRGGPLVIITRSG